MKKAVLLPLLLPTIIILLGIYEILFAGKIYKGVSIAGVDVSALTPQQANNKLVSAIKTSDLKAYTSDGQEFTIDVPFVYHTEETTKNAYDIGRKGTFFEKTQQKAKAITKGINLPIEFTYTPEALEQSIENLAKVVNVPAVKPEVQLKNEEIVINPGKDGKELDKDGFKRLILKKIAYNEIAYNKPQVEIPLNLIVSHLEDIQVQALKDKAEKLVGKKLELFNGEFKFTYSDRELVSLLSPLGIDKTGIDKLVKKLAGEIDREPQNARFIFDGKKVKEFAQGKEGLAVKQEELAKMIASTLENPTSTNSSLLTIEIPVIKTAPEISTGEVNNLGIKELLGKGSSRFKGSIASRVHNIALAASRLNGILIKPQETLSFNNALGDVSAYTGYQQAYVIREGRTVLGDGGGVCQVSTTLFRAALFAGLPIIERRAHSYRVGYYEQDSKPGLDATVYSPSADLKIKNDTQAYILIQAKADTKNMTLTFELYGTLDGRDVTVSTPRVWDITPAPAPLYQDDPSIPTGKTKQIDFAADGTKASFDYTVTRGGEALQSRTFYSSYRPWQAVFLRGTGQ